MHERVYDQNRMAHKGDSHKHVLRVREWPTRRPTQMQIGTDHALQPLQERCRLCRELTVLTTTHRGMRVRADEYVGVAREEWRRLTDLMRDFNVTYVQLVPRVGLSAGRNALVDACRTKYFVLLDDDVFFTATTRLDILLEVLEQNPDVQIAAGAYTQYNSTRATAEVNDYTLVFEPTPAAPAGTWRAFRPSPPRTVGECHRVHAAHNLYAHHPVP